MNGSYHSEIGCQACDVSPWESAVVVCPNLHLMLEYRVESGYCTNISLQNLLAMVARKGHFAPYEQKFNS